MSSHTASIADFDLFWTMPPDRERTFPSDPLGLDAVREELSDRLVPVLTGRTVRVEDFLWTLVIIKWSSAAESDDKRLGKALEWERRIKLWWAHRDPTTSFTGVREARAQAEAHGAPRMSGDPLLGDQRSQGLLGAYGRPLRTLKLVQSGALRCTDDGDQLVRGAGAAPSLSAGDWGQWDAAFARAEQGLLAAPAESMRALVCKSMPEVERALRAVRWSSVVSWGKVATHLGAATAPYARFAERFLRWSLEMSRAFDDALRRERVGPCPLPVPPDIGLISWRQGVQPFVRALAKGDAPGKVLADWHASVYKSRSYGRGDLLAEWESGRFVARPAATAYLSERAQSPGDCRWRNAVAIMRPRGNS